MAQFSPPPLRFPIGQFEVPGQRDPVYVYPDQAFWDYITSIFERIGGENGLSTEEVVALIQVNAYESAASVQRRQLSNPIPDPVIQRSNASEVQALRERVQALESQIGSARAQNAILQRAMDDLIAQVRRMPSLEALARRISDLEAATL